MQPRYVLSIELLFLTILGIIPIVPAQNTGSTYYNQTDNQPYNQTVEFLPAYDSASPILDSNIILDSAGNPIAPSPNTSHSPWMMNNGPLPARNGTFGGSTVPGNNEITGDSGPGFWETAPRRTGCFQSISGSALWIPTGSANTLGITQLSVGTLFGFAMPTMESPLLITPTFSPWIFEGNVDGVREKQTRYSSECQFRWLTSLFGISHYKLEIAATPGWHSDFNNSSWDAFRVPARAGFIWHYNPRTTLVLGVGYLDRTDYRWMPYGGVIWVPNGTDWVFSLLFPQPKIAKQIKWWGGAVGKDTSNWIFLGGEAAGGRWTYTTDGISGMDQYRDYRLLIGWERKSVTGINLAFEFGGVFWRRFERTSERSAENTFFNPKESVFLRIRGSF